MISREMQSSHWAGKSHEIIESYWRSPSAILRSKWFCNQLKGFSFESIMEVGFFSGRNLYYIGREFDVGLFGIEVNKKAVIYAKEKIPSAHLIHSDLFKLDEIDINADIVFTSGTLIHVPPTDLKNALGVISSKANKYVMHIESFGLGELVAGPKHFHPTYKISDQYQWAHNIGEAYRSIGYNIDRLIDLPSDCVTNGASQLIIIKK